MIGTVRTFPAAIALLLAPGLPAPAQPPGGIPRPAIPGVLLTDGEQPRDLNCYAGPSASAWTEPVAGKVGGALALSYRTAGEPEGYWGAIVRLPAAVRAGDWSRFVALRGYFRSREGRTVRVLLVEQGKERPDLDGEYWRADFAPGKEWRGVTLAFADFVKSPEWQPEGQDGNGTLDLAKVGKLILRSPSATAETDSIAVDELYLIER
jgi:hypothetical protein